MNSQENNGKQQCMCAHVPMGGGRIIKQEDENMKKSQGVGLSRGEQ